MNFESAFNQSNKDTIGIKIYFGRKPTPSALVVDENDDED
jgi:hypothetical protein